MSRELPRTPSVYLSMFFGGSLTAAWISAHPSDLFIALCLGTGSCAGLMVLLLSHGFDDAFSVQRRLRAEQLLQTLEVDPNLPEPSKP